MRRSVTRKLAHPSYILDMINRICKYSNCMKYNGQSPTRIHMWHTRISASLSSLSTNASRKLHVFRCDCNAIAVDACQIGVLENADEVALTGLLQGHNCLLGPSHLGVVILSYLTHQSHKGELPNQQICWPLVFPDLPQCNCTRTITVGFFYTTNSWRIVSNSLTI